VVGKYTPPGLPGYGVPDVTHRDLLRAIEHLGKAAIVGAGCVSG